MNFSSKNQIYNSNCNRINLDLTLKFKKIEKMSACHLYDPIEKKPEYIDRKSGLTDDDYKKALDNSTTIYVGLFLKILQILDFDIFY